MTTIGDIKRHDMIKEFILTHGVKGTNGYFISNEKMKLLED